MSYLRQQDYVKSIQLENLNQIINFDPNIRIDAELNAEEEITSYLSQKFDLVEEFTGIEVYDPKSTYNAGITIELNGSTWVSSQTYVVDDVVLYNGNIYQSTGTTSGSTPATTMILLGPQYKLYHTIIPFDYWDYDLFYTTGENVYWRGKTYQSLIAGSGYIPDNKIRKTHIDPSFGVVNYNTTIGTLYWGTGNTYSVPAGQLLNTTYIKHGDFRSQQMIQKYVDITLYHIHKRIAPKNVPDVRSIAFDSAVEWLKGCAAGDITPNLRVKTYRQGGAFRINSIPKNNNNY